jgi:hypothetical protein
VAPNIANHPAGHVGALPPCLLKPSGTFVAPTALFAAFTPLWVFFPVAGGLSATLVGSAAISSLFWTPWPGPRQHPSKFELLLCFVGDRLANLFHPDIPELFAAFLGPVPTIVGAIFTSFKLVGSMVFFYLNWLVRGCFVAKKGCPGEFFANKIQRGKAKCMSVFRPPT